MAGTEYRLSAPQQRAVLSLVAERERMELQVRQAIVEVNQAIDELARLLGDVGELPETGDEGRREFHRSGGQQGPIVLRWVPVADAAGDST